MGEMVGKREMVDSVGEMVDSVGEMVGKRSCLWFGLDQSFHSQLRVHVLQRCL